MENVKNELLKRNIPDVLTPDGKWTEQRRDEVFDIMLKNVFGYPLPDPVKMEFIEYGFDECSFAEGTYDEEIYDYFKSGEKAVYKKVRVVCHLSENDFPGVEIYPEAGGKFEFDLNCYMPKIKKGEKIPAIAAIALRESLAARGLPIKDIVEKGVALFAFRYRHIVNDYPERNKERHLPEFDGGGLDRLYYGDYRLRDDSTLRKGDEPGTIAMWSWGASRAMDYIQTQGAYINLDKVGVTGHSRLGKTALLAGASDKRFTHVLPGASCAAGVALSRLDRKENLEYMTRAFPEWFCENLKTSYNSPLFDMHFLVACVAPRKLYVSNAADDAYCDENSEYLSCAAASEAYKCLGLKGLAHPDRLPQTGDKFHDGDIGYHLRAGQHTYSLEDWTMMLEFFLK